MKCNQAGLDLIQSFEQCKLEAYEGKADKAGVVTIGWGHVGGYQMGDTITQEEADSLFAADVDKFSKGVALMLDVDLTDNQFSALVSLAFNLGLGKVESSTLLRLVNAGNLTAAALQFPRWDHGNLNGQSVELEGLKKRRIAEETLFNTA